MVCSAWTTKRPATPAYPAISPTTAIDTAIALSGSTSLWIVTLLQVAATKKAMGAFLRPCKTSSIVSPSSTEVGARIKSANPRA